MVSGPKGVSYQISAEELARRELKAMRRRVTGRLVAFLSQAAAIPGASTEGLGEPIPEGATLAELEDINVAIGRAEDQLADLVHEASAKAGRAALANALSAVRLSVQTTSSGRAARAHPSPIEKQLADIAALAVPLGADLMSAVEDLARRATAESAQGNEDEAAILVTHVRQLVAISITSDKASRRLEKRRRAAIAKTLDLDNADSLRDRISVATSFTVLKELETATEALRTEQRAAETRKLVTQKTIEALEELGYRVDTTTSDGATKLWAARPDWPQYGIDLVIPASNHEIRTVPVAVGATDPRDDKAFEVSACDDISRVRERLGSNGIDSAMVRGAAPGTVPIDRVGARQRTQKLREKTISHG